MQALQHESGQNAELREDLTALSAELHRLQTLQREQPQPQPETAEPSPSESAPELPEPLADPQAAEAAAGVNADLAAANEEAQPLRLVRGGLVLGIASADAACSCRVLGVHYPMKTMNTV